MRGSFTIVATADRYDLGDERMALARDYPDLDVEIRIIPAVTEDELIAAAADADAILVSTRDPITRRVLSRLPRLRVVGSYGVGLDHVDLPAAADSGVVVTHFPEYCTSEVADHATSLLLALNRRIVELDRNLRRGAWAANRASTRGILQTAVPPLREMTLGIVGLGRIGRAVAQRTKPFGLTIIAADPNLESAEIVARGAEPVAFEELLRRADAVTIHCPLTPTSRGLIDAAALARMKPSAILVNTARGPIVDLDALVAALRKGRLAGAALDVTDPEPLPTGHPLFGLENVILTPHSAYYSERAVDVVRRETFASVISVLRGRMPPVVANPAVLERVALAP